MDLKVFILSQVLSLKCFLKKLQNPESVLTFEKEFLYNNHEVVEITYCGSSFVDSGMIVYSENLKTVYVTPKYKDKTFNGIEVTVREDYICPSLIFIDKIKYICTNNRNNNHINIINLVFLIVIRD